MIKQHVHIHKKIESIRKELHKCGMKNGLTNEKTLMLSKELDNLITEMIRDQKELSKMLKCRLD